jgi:16S rRNA (guanine(966)-N(2))-methyltransferase RsmD
VRVIAGEFRSRRLLSLPGLETRPTPDRLRETLFNILAPAIEGSTFVDAYAGTGSVGIEAISRGAKLGVFIEKDRQAVEIIKANLNSLGIRSQGRIIRGMAALHLASVVLTTGADVVFIDPPYPKDEEYRTAFEALSAKPPALTIVQHSVRYAIPDEFEALARTRTVRQGDNALSFFKPRVPAADAVESADSAVLGQI